MTDKKDTNWLTTMFKQGAHRVKQMERESFFHSEKEEDMHLVIAHYTDGTSIGKVMVGNSTVFIGTGEKAKLMFHTEYSKLEAKWVLMKAKVKSIFGADFPHNLRGNEPC